MTQDKVTHIVVVLDRSGSMDAVRDDAIGGFNAFVSEQRRLDGGVKLTLVQFDSEWSVTWSAMALGDVPPLTRETYIPRAGTALYDAIGRATALAEESNVKAGGAEQVVIAILTDGQENSSRELDATAVRSLIRRKTGEGYTFLFLAANIDVARTADAIGIDARNTGSFSQRNGGTRDAFRTMSQQVREARTSGGSLRLSTGERKKLN